MKDVFIFGLILLTIMLMILLLTNTNKECLTNMKKGDIVDGNVIYLALTNGEIQDDIRSKKLVAAGDKWLFSPNVGTEGYNQVSDLYAPTITQSTKKAYSADTKWETISNDAAAAAADKSIEFIGPEDDHTPEGFVPNFASTAAITSTSSVQNYFSTTPSFLPPLSFLSTSSSNSSNSSIIPLDSSPSSSLSNTAMQTNDKTSLPVRSTPSDTNTISSDVEPIIMSSLNSGSF